MKVVLIEWFDCTYADITSNPDDILASELIEMQTVGWLVGETKRFYALASEYTPNGDETTFRHVTWIPKVNVIRVTFLKSARSAK